jgi:Tfp pilus assembly protein PilF/TolB-like protein
METGTLISHYELGGKLGEGGMGEVYKAWDCQLKRPVALKFLRTSQCSPAQVARFEQEARVVAALNHANIATIHEINESDGRPFLAFEYLPGGTLKAALDQLRLSGQQISLAQGLEYAIQLVDALAYAHREGVIHRDIKTANAMFTASGALKLTDFGLAKFGEGIDVTQTGTVMGTPTTMSPEQARGQDSDERSDIFSVGVVLFELFSGEMPFKGANAPAIIYQVVHEPAPQLRQFRPDVLPQLEQIIAKALRKNPTERYQSAGELAAELRKVQRELQVGNSVTRNDADTVVLTDAPTGVSKRGWLRSCSRRRLVRAAYVSAAAAVALAIWLALPVRQTRLVILPFNNIGGNSKDQVLADGFRELLIGKLTGLERPGGLLVTVVTKKETGAKEVTSPADARTRLGANLVLTGSLVHTEEEPRMVVHLQDPQTLEERGSQTINMGRDDLSAAAANIVAMLKLGATVRLRMAVEERRAANPEAIRLYIEGRGLLQNDELDASEAAFRDALKVDMKYGAAWAGLADTLFQKYQHQKVTALIQEADQNAGRALSLQPNAVQVRLLLAQIRLAQNDLVTAEQELKRALTLQPANARAYQLLGWLYEGRKNPSEAEKTYRQAIVMRPDDPAGYIHLGAFYYVQNDLSRAERSFRDALAVAPDNYKAHYNLGAVYEQQERYSAAISELETSKTIAPTASAYSNLGVVYYDAGLYAEAAEMFRQAIAIAGDNSEYIGNYADACRWAPGQGDRAPELYRKAIALLRQTVVANPMDARLHARLATYYVAIRTPSPLGVLAPADRAEAMAEIREALRLDSAQPLVQLYAAVVFEQLGERAKALDAVSKILKEAPGLMRAVRSWPVLQTLRKDPAFGEMVSRRN